MTSPLRRIVDNATNPLSRRQFVRTAIVGAAVYVGARAVEEVVIKTLVDPVVDQWWKQRPPPLVSPPCMGKRDILERA
jgi:hypothetical protein